MGPRERAAEYLVVRATPSRRAGVLGHPIDHSLSPVLHRAAYAALGLDWDYQAFDVTEEALPGFMDDVDSTWAGLSLTMPLKVAAVPLVDFLEPMAKLLGLINTVVVQYSGKTRTLVGANTDVYGIVAALKEREVTSAGPAVVLGGGATATSALAALGQLGTHAAVVAVRDRSRAAPLMRAATKMGVSVRVIPLEEAPRFMEECTTVISTIPDAASAPLASQVGALPPQSVVVDVTYHPLVSELGHSWERKGGIRVGGERMLLHQAAEQVRLMTGLDAPLEQMDKALQAAISA